MSTVGQRAPAPAAPLVSLQGVSVVFGAQVRALDDVTLTLECGDILGLVGESGSGKTTLCRVLVGLTPPSTGSVAVGGQSVSEQLARQPLVFRRRRWPDGTPSGREPG